jgi:hypothetical protein
VRQTRWSLRLWGSRRSPHAFEDRRDIVIGEQPAAAVFMAEALKLAVVQMLSDVSGRERWTELLANLRDGLENSHEASA